MRVAVIGLGAMGLPMARRLIAAGHDVVGWDASAERRAGAQEVRLAEAAARGAEVVLLSLPHDAAVLSVAELVLAAPPAPGAVVLDCSTVSPQTPRRLAPRFSRAGYGWIDAPVSGGPAGAAAGTLTVMAGAEPGVLERARPVLAAIAGKVVAVGGPGAGAVAKLVRVRTHNQNATIAAMWTAARYVAARRWYRVATRRKSFSRQNMRSMAFRPR